MTRDKLIAKHHDALIAAQVTQKGKANDDVIEHDELARLVPEEAPTPEILDGLVQKALIGLLKQKLDADPSLNQRFAPQTKVPLWNQLLLGARVKELARAKIVKKGGAKKLRYDVADLSKTFFGKALLGEAGLARQTVLDGDELARLEAACAKIKLTLPQSIEPTTTEMFFDDLAQPAPKPARSKKKKKADEDDDE